MRKANMRQASETGANKRRAESNLSGKKFGSDNSAVVSSRGSGDSVRSLTRARGFPESRNATTEGFPAIDYTRAKFGGVLRLSEPDSRHL
jgi:hypothetical protein